MAQEQLIPLIPSVPSLGTEDILVESDPNGPCLAVHSYVPYRRFAMEVIDDGLDSFGLIPGDYAVFREHGWPTNECQICLIAFAGEMTVRLLEGLYNTEPTLRVSGDKIDPITRNRNDFIVLGTLDGVIKRELARVLEPAELQYDRTGTNSSK